MRTIAFVQLKGAYAHALSSHQPIVVIRNARVFDACAKARERGVVPGQTLRQSLHCCPDLQTTAYDQVYFQLVAREFLDIFHEHARAVEPLSPHQVFLDFTGTGVDAAALRGILETIVPRYVLSVCAGLASCKFLARTLVGEEEEGGVPIHLRMLAPHQEEQFLRNLSVEKLDMLSDNMQKRLLLLGMKKVGQLMVIPPGELMRRFGEEGKRLLVFLQEGDNNPVKPLYPEDILLCQWCGETIFSLDACLQALKTLVERLARVMRERQVAARHISLLLDGDKGTPILLHRQRSRAYRTQEAMFHNLAAGLKGIWPGFEVSALQLIARSIIPLRRQQLELVSGPGGTDATDRMQQLDNTLMNLAQRYEGEMVEKGWKSKGDRREAMLRYYDPLRFHRKGCENRVQTD